MQENKTRMQVDSGISMKMPNPSIEKLTKLQKMKTQGQINNLITLIDLRLGRNEVSEQVKDGFVLFKECLLSEDEDHDLIVIKGNSEQSRAIASLAIDWMQGVLPRDSDILGIIGK